MSSEPKGLVTDYPPELLERFDEYERDHRDEWPGELLDRLGKEGRLRSGVPAEFGGTDDGPRRFAEEMIELAKASLTVAFIRSQRDAACQRIARSGNSSLKAALFPRLASGTAWATVGISHLTTSRQHVAQPAVVATPSGRAFRLNGTIPWVTGAAQSDEIVVGATIDDGRQILGLTPSNASGVIVESPVPLLALRGSCTAAVVLEDVELPLERVLAGPVDNVVRQTSGGPGSLMTSVLAVGAASRPLAFLIQQAERRPSLASTARVLRNEWQSLRERLVNAAESEETREADQLRGDANSLVLRMAQAAVAVSKGAGFVEGHPAGQWLREAAFFLVWSCPESALLATLRNLSELGN